ncbi:MAG: small multi-drug export protein [Bacillaceae bacterium]|nr:small multi-drug export protein [Bacillaceae bacterium]
MERILAFLDFVPDEWVVIIISCLPFIELRGALPVAMSVYQMGFWEAWTLSVIGNIIPVLPLLILFRPLSRWMMRFRWYRIFYDWLYHRTMKKSENVEKYGALGLVLFTAVPLPTTGAWTACVAASLFDIKIKYSLPAISAGVVIAGFIIGLLSQSVIASVG